MTGTSDFGDILILNGDGPIWNEVLYMLCIDGIALITFTGSTFYWFLFSLTSYTFPFSTYFTLFKSWNAEVGSFCSISNPFYDIISLLICIIGKFNVVFVSRVSSTLSLTGIVSSPLNTFLVLGLILNFIYLYFVFASHSSSSPSPTLRTWTDWLLSKKLFCYCSATLTSITIGFIHTGSVAYMRISSLYS